MDPLELVKLAQLMKRSSGRPEVKIGLIDGPVALDHPDLSTANIRSLPGKLRASCVEPTSTACVHGTFVAGILCSVRNSSAPAICPNCAILVRPIFAEGSPGNKELPSTTPEELAMAITECVDAGATVINLSSALPPASSMAQRNLEQALAYAAKRGTLIVAAAGNHGMIGSSTITQHQWVLPVVACDRRGRPTSQSNLGASIGRRGLSAPGYEITSLGVGGKLVSLGGTSAATPFVTGTIALLASEFPGATPAQIKLAITQGASPRRNAIVPPLLNAWAAYEAMVTSSRRSVNA